MLRWGTALCMAAAVASAEARQQTPQRAPGMTHEGVRAVLVDVVVRDKRGQPVRDLSASDFEVTEDGVAQTIGSFTPVASTAQAAPAQRLPGRGTGAR